ncbi:MAG: hypothetical protein ABF265_07810 [Polaribacter sp.]
MTKGKAELYPTMVCHIDTVHEINNNIEIVQIDDVLLAIDTMTMERYGIGGDDKVGVYITLQMLKHFDNFKAVFYLDEEVGCLGSSQSLFSFFDDSTIVLECDRRGYNDFVTSISGTKLSDDVLHQDIDNILTKYNRDKVNGGITDVGEIAEKNAVQVANMSCGYYDPHSDNEYIVISEVESTKQMCIEIFKATNHKRYEIPLDDRAKYSQSFNYNNSYYWEKYDAINDYSIKDEDDIANSEAKYQIGEQCEFCTKEELWYDDYENRNYCMNCQCYVAEINSYESFEKNVEPKYINNEQ